MTEKTPQRFGDYELVHRLGVGGMAETFLAIRRGPAGFQQRVCLKRILATFEQDPSFVDMFLREARLSALLHHGHIAQVLDFGEVAGTYYLTLELVEGTDLRHVIRHGQRNGASMTPDLTIYLAHALAAALEFAHTADERGEPKGIVHRDVSPSNVLLSNAGEVKLTDFGIAKAMNAPNSIQSGALKGKIPYMAPEYATGGNFDARSDLFSLGVTLYESLTGRRPYDGASDMETLARARRGARVPLSKLAGDSPRPFVMAVDSLLSPDPGDRPEHAGAFLDALAGTAPSALARRQLGALVRSIPAPASNRDETALAETRPAATSPLAETARARPNKP